jgi:hypothetical protein
VDGTEGDDKRWILNCPEGYISNTGLFNATCLGNGVVFYTANCVNEDCAASQQALSNLYHRFDQNWIDGRTTTCAELMHEGDTCSLTCKRAAQGSDEEDELVIGYWTCKRGYMRGNPTCQDIEGQHWLVSWVLPKITGGFRFAGEILRHHNVSNDTMTDFGNNVTLVLASMMREIMLQDFNVMNYELLEQNTYLIIHNADTFNPTWEPVEFQLNYEILIWDDRYLEWNQDILADLIVFNSSTQQLFKERCFDLIGFRYQFGSIVPLMIPLTFNETFIAPDTDIADFATPTMRLQLSVLAACGLCEYLLRLLLV